MLSGLYVLYMWRDRTPRERCARARSPPPRRSIWALSDCVVTGDPLHSLHGTADLAEAADRRRTSAQVPVLDRAVLRLHAARAARRRRADRARLRVAVPAPRGDAAARGGRGDDRGVRDRADLRAAADRPLHAHAGRCCCRSSTGSRWRLAAAPDGHARRTRWMAIGLFALGALDRLPALARDDAARPAHARRARRRAVRRPARRRRRRRAVRAAFARLRAALRRRPPAGPVPALLARRRPGHGRHGRGKASPWASCCSAAPVADTKRFYGVRTSRTSPRRPATADLPRTALARARGAGLPLTRPPS